MQSQISQEQVNFRNSIGAATPTQDESQTAESMLWAKVQRLKIELKCWKDKAAQFQASYAKYKQKYLALKEKPQ